MSNPFQSYTSEIVTHLIKMERDRSREWFCAIRGCIERKSGKKVASIYDYVTANIKSSNDQDVRRAILSSIVDALRQDNIYLVETDGLAS